MCDHDDGFDRLDWDDIALAGALLDEIANEQKKSEKLKKEMRDEQQADKEDSDDPLK